MLAGGCACAPSPFLALILLRQLAARPRRSIVDDEGVVRAASWRERRCDRVAQLQRDHAQRQEYPGPPLRCGRRRQTCPLRRPAAGLPPQQ